MGTTVHLKNHKTSDATRKLRTRMVSFIPNTRSPVRKHLPLGGQAQGSAEVRELIGVRRGAHDARGQRRDLVPRDVLVGEEALDGFCSATLR